MSRANYTYAAYDAGLPCRNPECKSHGLPHPNCRCYGDLPESPQSATQMVLPNGRWGRDFSGGFSPTKGAPDSSNAAASASLGAPSEVPANNAATGSPIDAGKEPSPGISPNGVSPKEGVATNVPAPSPMDYAKAGESQTDITPAGTNKASTGFGLGTGILGVGVGLAAMGMMGMNFLRRKKAPKEKESDYEDGVMALAEGGEVGNWQVVDHYCQTCRPHRPDCEYFAEGGQAGESNWVPEAPAQQSEAPEQPQGFDENWVPEAPAQPQDEAPQAAPIVPDSNGYVSEKTGEPAPPEAPDPTLKSMIREHAQGGLRMIGAEAEAFVKGFIGGPIASLAESGYSQLGVPGLSFEEQRKREQDFGTETSVFRSMGNMASILSGKGAIGVISNKIGGTFLKDAMAGALIGGMNEVEKAMIEGKDHDFTSASSIIDIGGSALLQGAFGKIGSSVDALAAKELGSKVKSAIAGIAAHAQYPDEPEMVKKIAEQFVKKADISDFAFHSASFNQGVKYAQKIGAAYSTDLAIDSMRNILHPIKLLQNLAIAVVGKHLAKPALSAFGTALVNSAENGIVNNFGNTMDWVGKAVSGNQRLVDGVGVVLHGLGLEGIRKIDFTPQHKDEAIDDMHQTVEDYDPEQQMKTQTEIDNSQVPQGFAEGGKVSANQPTDSGLTSGSDFLSERFPEQNMILQMTRGNMSKYLKSLQPQQPATSLPFDSKADLREQDRSYKKALLVAHDPLSVLGHVAKGTLEPEHLQHLGAMYPEVSQVMQKEITKQMLEMQMKGQKPPYKVRQGLSLLLGAPLSGEFTPQNMQAAQAIFVKADPNQQAGKKPTKTKQSLSKSSQAFLTPDQSRQTRYQQRG